MSRGAPPTEEERRQIAEAKALYLDKTNPLTLAQIAARFGHEIGWVLHIKSEGRWPERPRVRPGAQLTVTHADVKRHGDCAEAVVYLRDVGLLVAPFKDGYRVGTDVLSRDELKDRAETERKKRGGPKTPVAVAAPPVSIVQKHPVQGPRPPAASSPIIVDALCGCGKPKNHLGRCWVRRGLSAPPPEKAVLTETERKLSIDIMGLKAANRSLEARIDACVAFNKLIARVCRQDQQLHTKLQSAIDSLAAELR
jgi:hypothetical protein